MEAEDHKEKVKEFKTQSNKEAMHIVQNIFPKKVTELNELLLSEKFTLSRLSEINADVNIPVPEPITAVNNDTEDLEPSLKKRKRDPYMNDDLQNISGSKVMVFPNGVAPCNKHIVEMVDILKPKVIELLEYSNKIKMWITYLIPRIEDGNNFGVSIQEDTMAEARQVETEAATYLDQVSRYFMTRGKIVAKIAKYPHIADIRRTVQELDEKEFINLRLVVCELRNHYASLHDIIHKNWDKIIKPRNFNADNLY